MPFSFMAATICSDSACFTRGSLAPWATRIGILIWSTLDSGERYQRRSASVSGLPTRSWNWATSGPSRRDRLDEGLQVRRADDINRAAEHVGRERGADQGGVAAVGAAGDRHPLPVDAALPDDVLDRVDEVVVHGRRPLLVAGVEEILPVAGRAAVVDLDAHVAPVGQPLGFGVEPPVSRAHGPAVDDQHRR